MGKTIRNRHTFCKSAFRYRFLRQSYCLVAKKRTEIHP